MFMQLLQLDDSNSRDTRSISLFYRLDTLSTAGIENGLDISPGFPQGGQEEIPSEEDAQEAADTSLELFHAYRETNDIQFLEQAIALARSALNIRRDQPDLAARQTNFDRMEKELQAKELGLSSLPFIFIFTDDDSEDSDRRCYAFHI
jgi:hypothetical protein